MFKNKQSKEFHNRYESLIINLTQLLQECFEALLKLLEWSWNTFHSITMEIDSMKGNSYLLAMTDLGKLVYISRACLRLLKIFVTEVYPDGGM